MRHGVTCPAPRPGAAAPARTLLAGLALAGMAAGPVVAGQAAQGGQAISIAFAVQAGRQAVPCGQPLQGLGVGAATAWLRALRFYVSELALVDAQGTAVPLRLVPGEWQDESVALIDLADGAARCTDAGTRAVNAEIAALLPAAAAGGAQRYTGLRFTLGVPPVPNHSDYAAASSPLDVQSMAWSWQGGRKFMLIELEPDGGVARMTGKGAPGRTFQLHLGSTGCRGSPMSGEIVDCQRPNRIPVALDGFDAARDRVTFDLSALLARTNVSEDRGGALGCMSAVADPECGSLFSALGLDAESGRPLRDTAGTPHAVWRVERR